MPRRRCANGGATPGGSRPVGGGIPRRHALLQYVEQYQSGYMDVNAKPAVVEHDRFTEVNGGGIGISGGERGPVELDFATGMIAGG